MNRHVVALLALFAITACEAPTVQSPRAVALARASFQSAPTNQEWWASDAFTIFNPCDGDEVDVTGKIHVSLMTDPSGVSRVRINGADLTGVSAVTDTAYNFIRVSDEQGVLNPLDVMYTARYRVISRGSAPNFLLALTAHLYFDGPDFHADILQQSAKCTG